MNSKIQYLKKAWREMKQLNKRIGKSGTLADLSTFADFMKCYIVYGCLISQYVNGNFWKYSHTQRKKILTYRGVVEFIDKCNRADKTHLLENKVDFNRHFKEFVDRKWLAAAEMTLEQLKELASSTEYLIVKPLDDCEGRGIEMVKTSGMSPRVIEDLFDQLHGKNIIIEERIYNHPDMNFNNNSINTIRINSLTDRNGEVHLFKPVLRAGVGKAFVDNYNAGGCEYGIDLESGIIITPRYQNYRLEGVTHPGCDKIMPGYQIPMWPELLTFVKDACKQIPECRFIGWDVAITPKGLQLIEGNHNPGNVGIEFFGETGWYEKLKPFI